MLAIERRKIILDQLQKDKRVVVSDLSRRFGVSEETIRRDLERFEQEGVAVRSYGGAVLKDNVASEVPFQSRKKKNLLGKKVIGEIVADMVDDGEHIFIDPSTTTLTIVKELRQAGKKNITIITNAIEVLVECAEYSDWDVISLGGTLQPGKFALVGPQAIEGIEGYHADKAIIACKAIDMQKGVTDSNVMFTQVKRAMLENARERIVAVDSTKFDQVGFSRICALEEIDTIVTDLLPSEEWQNYLSEREVRCLYGSEDQSYSICK